MYVKQLKRKCSVRGCKNTDTYAISRTREVGNSVIICKSCLGKALGTIDEIDPGTKNNFHNNEVAEIPSLFFNAVARGTVKNEAAEEPISENVEEPDETPEVESEAEDEEPIVFICPVCDKVCKSEAGLQKHMATHKDAEIEPDMLKDDE